MTMKLGLYVHIPFCLQKCFYCDFPSFANIADLKEAYTDALCKEILMQGALLPCAVVDTIYIGGGTPTTLSDGLLRKILASLKQAFHFNETMECSIEANPGTVNPQQLESLRAAGVNRISFGVQTFEDNLLVKIGRIHTAQAASQSVLLAQAAGFTNINLDLMYGLPGQTLAMLEKSMQIAMDLGVDHISIYGLIVEEGTVFAAKEKQGQLELPSEELVEQMYDRIMSALPNAGYERYEISNFAKAKCYSRHNLKYWQDQPYLGLGAAAHSYINDRRYANTHDVKAYIAAVNSGKVAAEVEEEMTSTVLMEEFCFLALRTKWGIDCGKFAEKFGRSIFAVYGNVIKNLQEKKLLTVDARSVYLTALGMKYGNQVFAEFLLDT
ncbi:oxygen-independent coproporphyrinogen-3 oxidase [Propionispira arboris]|uniref:Heme chaperone HemW n=2 Tax=Propionispira arboris TaxID=84035 RepID=A0A1H7CY65_9FIRM|nr:oxygen-independent coproporphyrinogen-3 oxidase [Propionispira arboris]